MLGTFDFDLSPSVSDDSNLFYLKMFHISNSLRENQGHHLRLFPITMTHEKAIGFCHHLGGMLWEPQSDDDLQNAAAMVASYKTSN